MQCEGVDQSGHHKPPTWHRWLSSASLPRHYLRGTGEHVYSGWMRLVVESPAAFDGLPRIQASWSGDAVRAVRDGFTLAPYSKSSLAHSRLPEAQALHRGVLPWMVRTSTWEDTASVWWNFDAACLGDTMEGYPTWAPASSSRRAQLGWACMQASWSGVMLSTVTMLTDAPLSISCLSCSVRPWDAASCRAVRSAQKP